MSHNNRFKLTNPLEWFLRHLLARTTPSPAGTDLKVKRIVRSISRRKINGRPGLSELDVAASSVCSEKGNRDIDK
jgi:hypothetical protein